MRAPAAANRVSSYSMEETREQILAVGAGRGWDLHELERQGLLRLDFVPPVEIAADALLHKAKEAVKSFQATRVVVDSLSSLDLSLSSRGRFPELAYALAKSFRAQGVTTVLTNASAELMGSTVISGRGIGSAADNIILLRYVEVEARLARAIVVLKVRGSAYEHVLRELVITDDKLTVREAFREYRGVLTGLATPAGDMPRRRRGRDNGEGS